MSEFDTKVAQFKQTLQEPGFTTDISDAPTIGEDEILEPEAVKDEPEPKSQRRSRKTDSLRKRVDQLVYENKLREAQTQELLNKVNVQEQLLIEKHNQLESTKQHSNAYYENNLVTREAAIIAELKVAREEGDLDQEIALTKALAQVTAEQSTFGLYKTQIEPKQNSYEPDPNYQPEPFYNQQVDYEPPENDILDSWLEKNPWADPESMNFSPSLRGEADTLANQLTEMLKYNGRADMIGTSEYFHSLDNLMTERYGSAKPEEPVKNYHVAPVSRNGSSQADQYISQNPNSTRRSLALTEDEYKIARNLQIKLPNGRYATGDEAVRRYAEAKRMGGNGSNKLIID